MSSPVRSSLRDSPRTPLNVRSISTMHCDSEISKQPVFVIDKPCDSEINGICIRHRICIESDAVEPIPLIALPQLRVNESLSGARALNNKELT